MDNISMLAFVETSCNRLNYILRELPAYAKDTYNRGIGDSFYRVVSKTDGKIIYQGNIKQLYALFSMKSGVIH